MSYKIKRKTITLTRGDTMKAQITLTDQDGEPYVPIEGDAIQFAMKRNYSDVEVLIRKDIPIDTLILVLDPEDTKMLDFGEYVYDIQLIRVTGEIDTFITEGTLILTEEVG